MRRFTDRIGTRNFGHAAAMAALLAGALGLASGRAEAQQLWGGYGRDAQHTALSSVASQAPERVLWSTPVDTNPPFTGEDIYAHYASPIITKKNTVIVTTRTDAGFQFRALRGLDGSAVWPGPLTTDDIVPPHNWLPVCGPTLVSGGLSLAMPGAGGTIYVRPNPDRGAGTVTQKCFYGLATYNANKAAFNAAVYVCTPITADSAGNL